MGGAGGHIATRGAAIAACPSGRPPAASPVWNALAYCVGLGCVLTDRAQRPDSPCCARHLLQCVVHRWLPSSCGCVGHHLLGELSWQGRGPTGRHDPDVDVAGYDTAIPRCCRVSKSASQTTSDALNGRCLVPSIARSASTSGGKPGSGAGVRVGVPPGRWRAGWRFVQTAQGERDGSDFLDHAHRDVRQAPETDVLAGALDRDRGESGLTVAGQIADRVTTGQAPTNRASARRRGGRSPGLFCASRSPARRRGARPPCRAVLRQSDRAGPWSVGAEVFCEVKA